jgi:hypothetical protein
VAECFCGCGRTVAFRWRPVNSRGRQIQETIAEVRAAPGRGRRGEDREYIEEAKRACDRLADSIHAQGEADKELEAETRALLRRHKERFGKPLFGRWGVVRR